MNAEFIEALNAIEKERGISKDILIDAFESALIAAYKRNYGAVGNVRGGGGRPPQVRPHSGPDRQAGGCAAYSRGRARRHI